MSAANFQRWMTVIGVWLGVTLISLGLFALTRTVESTVFTIALGVVTLVVIALAFIDLSGVRSEDS